MSRFRVPAATLDHSGSDLADLCTPQRARIRTVSGEPLGCRPEHADQSVLVEALAARQRQVVARWQLIAAGLTRSGIEHRLATGRLHRVHRGVYLCGHADPLPLALETAALLACGPDAALSHRSAAVIWGFMTAAPARIDVVVRGRNPAPGPGVRVHRTRALAMTDVRRLDGLPLTCPARTLLDLAAVLSERDLRWAVEEARIAGLSTTREIATELEKVPRRRGCAALRRVLARDAAPSITRSEAERRLLDLIRAARLRIPETNVRVAGFEVDALWRPEQLVVEVDGFAFHGSRSAFERDRRRDATLQARGLRVVRFSWRQLTDEPQVVIALLATLLERGRPAPGPSTDDRSGQRA